MHFWIDKRSQACGFGRARVSASLSGAGSGAGLGFAHPPRRIGGNKSFSTVPSIHRQQHGTQQQHQQHQHSHHHQQHQQQQQQQQSTSCSNSSSVQTTTAESHGRHYNQQHGLMNNNNIGLHNSGSSSYAQQQQQLHQQQQHIQPLPTTQQQSLNHNINNNAHQQQQHIFQRQQHQQSQQISAYPINFGNNIGTYNMNNNNNNNTSNTSNLTQLPTLASATNASATTAAVLTGAGTVVPVTTTTSNGRYGRHQFRSTQCPAINQMNNHAAHHHYDTRSYHHPQFGNMSVRHYQCGDGTTTQMSAPTTASTAALQQNTNSRSIGNHPQFNATTSSSNNVQTSTATTSAALPLHELRSGGIQQQQQNLHSPLQHVCGGITHSEGIDATSTSMVLGPMRTLHTYHHFPTHRSISNGNMRATITHNGIIDDSETQPIITQMKCGIWMSVVVVSVFLAGAKFYFDNQGSSLEVMIFCAFSATFFLAACTVSLCRLPKGLVTARHMADGNSRALVPCNQAGFAGTSGTSVPATANTQSQQLGQSNEQRVNELQERTAAAQAGPPPYHIAILLPEHSKDAVTDESPPPSYDKILI